jgi:hypothetical protein
MQQVSSAMNSLGSCLACSATIRPETGRYVLHEGAEETFDVGYMQQVLSAINSLGSCLACSDRNQAATDRCKLHKAAEDAGGWEQHTAGVERYECWAPA